MQSEGIHAGAKEKDADVARHPLQGHQAVDQIVVVTIGVFGRA